MLRPAAAPSAGVTPPPFVSASGIIGGEPWGQDQGTRANEDDGGRGDDREGRDNRGGGGRGGGAGGSGREDRQGSGSAGGKSPKRGGEMGQKDAAEVVRRPAQKAGTPAIAEGGALWLGAGFEMDPQKLEYLERRDDKFIRAEQQTMERKIHLEYMAKNEREKVSPTPSLPSVRDMLMALAVTQFSKEQTEKDAKKREDYESKDLKGKLLEQSKDLKDKLLEQASEVTCITTCLPQARYRTACAQDAYLFCLS